MYSETFINELEKIESENMNTFWLRIKISHIKCETEELEERRQKKETGILEKIQNSRFIDLNSMQLKKVVYFLNDPVIVIHLSETFKEKIRDKHLLQLFVEGKIYFEQYLSKLKDEVKFKLKDGMWSKFEVEVKIK